MNDRTDKTTDRPGWLDRKANVDRLWYGLLAFAAALAIAGFLYEPHPHFAVEKIPAFYAIFGFAAFVFIVFTGKALRVLIMRDEDYYERD